MEKYILMDWTTPDTYRSAIAPEVPHLPDSILLISTLGQINPFFSVPVSLHNLIKIQLNNYKLSRTCHCPCFLSIPQYLVYG